MIIQLINPSKINKKERENTKYLEVIRNTIY